MSSESDKVPLYRAAIIGAGRIGCGFDAPDSANILTHAHAISSSPCLELTAIVDSDSAKSAQAAKWGTRFFSDMDEMQASIKPDIVVIATPDKTHADLLMRLAQMSVRLVICEKPVVTTRAEEAQIREQVAGRLPVIVNFSRRFDSTVQHVRADLLAGKYGKVLSASGIYTKGISHNGPHMIDLARYLFGEMTAAHASVSVPDFPEGAASIGGVLAFERCPQFHLIAADARDYAIFELDILTQMKRLRFTDEGQALITHDVIDDPLYAGFRILSPALTQETRLSSALSNLYSHAVNVLDDKEESDPSLEDALKTQEACRIVAESLKTL